MILFLEKSSKVSLLCCPSILMLVKAEDGCVDPNNLESDISGRKEEGTKKCLSSTVSADSPASLFSFTLFLQ